LQAGSAGQSTVFLFSDNQMKEESFLEDINNILNTGTAPPTVVPCRLVAVACDLFGAFLLPAGSAGLQIAAHAALDLDKSMLPVQQLLGRRACNSRFSYL
jgi:hypothetical protein